MQGQHFSLYKDDPIKARVDFHKSLLLYVGISVIPVVLYGFYTNNWSAIKISTILGIMVLAFYFIISAKHLNIYLLISSICFYGLIIYIYHTVGTIYSVFVSIPTIYLVFSLTTTSRGTQLLHSALTFFIYFYLFISFYYNPVYDIPLPIEIMVSTSNLMAIYAIFHYHNQKTQKYQEQLKESLQFLQNVSDLNPSLIYAKDKDLKINFANKALLNGLQTSPEELWGKSIEDFNFSKESSQKIKQEDSMVIEKGKPIRLVEEYTRNGTDSKWFEITKIPLFDKNGNIKGLLGIDRDISQLKRTELALRQKEKNYQAFIKLSEDAISYISLTEPIPLDLPIDQQFDLYLERAYIADCNHAYAHFYGYDDPQKLIETKTKLKLVKEKENKKNIRFFYQTLANAKFNLANQERVSYNFKGEQCIILESIIGVVVDNKLHGLWGKKHDITKQRKAENALGENQLLLNSIINSTNDLVFSINLDMELLTFNKAASSVFYRTNSKKLAIGKNIIDCLIEEDKEVMSQYFEEVFQGKSLTMYPVLKDLETEELIHLAASFYPIMDKNNIITGCAVYAKNINELKETEQKLRISEQRYRTIFANTQMGIAMSSKGVFTDCNAAFAKMTGFTEEEIIGKDVISIMFAEDAEQSKKFNDDTYQTLKSIEFENRFIRKDGSKGWAWVHLQAIENEETNEIEYVGILADISSLKKIQNDLNTKNQELQKYIESNMQLENFAYLASHDLKSPIRSIVSFAQILQKSGMERLSTDEKDYLNFIIRASRNMQHLIDDLLMYSRVNTQKIKLSTINIRNLIKVIELELQSEIHQKNAQIICDKLPYIEADLTQMRQLFQNLITNAIKFQRTDVPPIVNICSKEEDEHYRFKVQDNGIGIPKEYQERIFLLFKKLHNPSEYEGTGIGLSLCKKIVEQHQGKIWLESEPNQGTTFYFTIGKDIKL